MHQAPKSNQDISDLSTNLTANDLVTDACLLLPCAIGPKRQTFPSKAISSSSSSILNKFFRGRINNPCLWKQNQRRPCRIIRQVGLCVMTLILGMPAYAQVTTDGTLSTPTGVDHLGNTWNISGGTRPGGGPTLYHSFNQFSVATGDTALFVNDSAAPVTNNILGRVTGGSISDIQGTIDSATNFPGANLFLMNPAGFIFGSGATLNVGGTFTATTANNIQSADQGIFNASLTEPNVLVSAAPEAFGFLNQAPPVMVAGSNAAIEIKGLNTQGGDILLVGRDASVNGTLVPGVEVNGSVTTSGGSITIASVDSPGQAVLGSINLDDFSQQGQVNITGTLDATGTPVNLSGGNVEIQGRSITMTGGSIFTPPFPSIPFGGPQLPGAIVIKATETASFTNSLITTNSSFAGGPAGSIFLSAGEAPGGMLTLNDTNINAQTISSPASPPGMENQVSLRAYTITMNGGQIQTDAASLSPFVVTGPGLDIEFSGAYISLSGGARVSASNSGPAHGGNVVFKGLASPAEEIVLSSNNSPSTSTTSIQTATTGPGKGGDVTFETKIFKLLDGANVTSGTDASSGASGKVMVSATQEVLISGQNQFGQKAQITTATNNGTGSAGSISITTENFTLSEGASLLSRTLNSQAGGTITVNATGLISLSDPGTEINTTSAGSGSGGTINLIAGQDIQMNNLNPGLTADSTGTGNGGAINLTSGGSILTNNGTVSTSAQQGTGGNIFFQAGQDIDLTNHSTVTAQAAGAGNAGSINFTANTADLANSTLTTSTVGSGNAGALTLNVGSFTSSAATLSSSTGTATGNAGSITLHGRGGAGTLPTEVTLANSTVSTTAEGTGAGGVITLGASGTSPLSLSNTTISASVHDIPAGGAPDQGLANIALSGPTLTISGGQITAETTGSRNAGAITLSSIGMLTTSGTTVSSSSTSAGNAGNLSFTSTGGSISFTNSTLTTSAPNANGGNQKFTATGPGEQIFFNNTTVSASVGGGTGGNINVDPGFIIMKGSNLLGTATSGEGGNIGLTAGVGIFEDTFSTLDVRSGTGNPSLNGSVNIRAPIQQLNGVIQPMPQNTVKVANLYAQRCAAQKNGQFSSLVAGGRDGVPPSPGGFLPSPLLSQAQFAQSLGKSEMLLSHMNLDQHNFQNNHVLEIAPIELQLSRFYGDQGCA